MRKAIKKAYDEYLENYRIKPEFISLNHNDFNQVVIEGYNDTLNPDFFGMHPLVLSDQPSGFSFHQKSHLDEVLIEFEKNNGDKISYVAYNPISIEIIGRGNNPDAELPEQRLIAPIEVDPKVIKAYQSYLEVIKTD